MIGIDARSALDPAALFAQATGLVALDWQRQYLRAMGNVCVVKGRQTGASTAAAVAALRCAIYNDAVDVVLISRSQKQSSEIARKARAGLRKLAIPLEQDSATMIRLANGSRIVTLPGTSGSVRGYSARLVVLDEGAFVPAETWLAARALTAAGGRWIVQSTPAGPFGDFYELVMSADPDWLQLSIRADQVPHISGEYLEQQRRVMAPDEFDQEFMAEFGKATAALFSTALVTAIFGDDP